MNLRRFLAEAGTLTALAIACALVSNAFAGRERKLSIPGDYPNATKVTARAESPAPGPFEPAPAAPAGSPVAAAVSPVPEDPAAPAAKAPAGKDPAGKPAAPAAGPAPAPLAAPATAPASPAPAPASELLARFPPHGQPYVEITGESAAWLHARGVLFLDARRTKEYAAGHVAGARSFPVWESETVKERVEAFVAEGRDTSLPVVLYCSGGDCEDSHMLAQTLFGAGFENLLVYRDGFPDWVRRGGAVLTGGPA